MRVRERVWLCVRSCRRERPFWGVPGWLASVFCTSVVVCSLNAGHLHLDALWEAVVVGKEVQRTKSFPDIMRL